MTSKRKNILTCLIIILLIIFIYVPVRTGFLEKQFLRSTINTTEKIVFSISSFEKSKKLQDKNLAKFYTLVQEKYPIALISAADKKNRILKTGKNDKYITTNAAYDSIMDSFIKDELKSTKKNDFVMRYFDQTRFYIFVRYLSDGKILIVYPYSLSLRLIIQLILEIMLISVFSIIITAFFTIRKNKKTNNLNDLDYKFIKTDVARKTENPNDEKEKKAAEKKKIKEENRKKKLKFDIDSMNDEFFNLFEYICGKYKSENASFYLYENSSTRLNKIFELKGKSFLKIKDSKFNSIDLNMEIINELKKSSTIFLNKGKKITIPVISSNNLVGIITIIRSKEFKGAEIADIRSRIKTASDALAGYFA